MQRKAYRIAALVIVSVFAPAWSCSDKPRPTVDLNPPADLLARADEPAMPAEALTSEEAYERARDAKVEWGRTNAGVIDRACAWLATAGVKLKCRP